MTTEAATPIEQRVELDLDALIRELDAATNRLPEEALRTCQTHREAVTPRLIEVLQEAVRLGREGTVRPGNAHFFALFLLTEFEAKESLPVILELFALREPVLEGLLGGAVTQTTRRVLAVLAGDQPDLIESLILNRQLDDYIRWEAASTLNGLVYDERMTRAEAIERFTRLLRSAIGAKDEWGVTIVVCEVGELNPLELQNEIKAAFDQHLVDESVIDRSCFEEYLLHPDQAGICPQLRDWKTSGIPDTVEELRGWYCFSEEARRPRPTPAAKVDHEVEPYGADLEPLDSFQHAQASYGAVRNEMPHVGRNDPCPCGSGKKYKKCCLRAANGR